MFTTNPQMFILSVVVVLLMIGLLVSFRLISILFNEVERQRETINENAEVCNGLIDYIEKHLVAGLNTLDDELLSNSIFLDILDTSLTKTLPGYIYPGREKIKVMVEKVKIAIKANKGTPLSEEQKQQIVKESNFPEHPFAAFFRGTSKTPENNETPAENKVQ